MRLAPHLLLKDAHDLLRLAFAQKAVVDVYAGELIADGLEKQRGYDRGIHAAGQRQEHLSGADLLFEQLHLVGDEAVHAPVALDADALDEAVQRFAHILRPRGQVRGMPLAGVVHAEDGQPQIVDGGIDLHGTPFTARFSPPFKMTPTTPGNALSAAGAMSLGWISLYRPRARISRAIWALWVLPRSRMAIMLWVIA